MYRIFNAFIEIEKDNRDEAIRTASLNAAAVYDTKQDKIIADYRTIESENDERG